MAFPLATQPQIIRANQRDVLGAAQLRQMADNVLRSWLGTRWLSRWEPEVELVSAATYYGLTSGLASRTLGDEYVDVWQILSRSGAAPSATLRAVLVVLQTFPVYLASRFVNRLGHTAPSAQSRAVALARHLSTWLEVLSEVNLAVFYLSGKYYSLAKRLLGIRHVSSLPQDPNSRPPSYALLGILLAIRLLHRAVAFAREMTTPQAYLSNGDGKAITASHNDAPRDSGPSIDDRSVFSMLMYNAEEVRDPETDPFTSIDYSVVPASIRANRRCTLCLEERTETTSTECGHLFCWSCIVGWGNEKPECPLCRQQLMLSRLLPLYNL